MGHDEPLLQLLWRSWVLLTKAQTDLVLGLLATVLKVGPQFYGHQDWGLGNPSWCPPCASIPCPCPIRPHPHCVPMPYAHFHIPMPVSCLTSVSTSRVHPLCLVLLCSPSHIYSHFKPIAIHLYLLSAQCPSAQLMLSISSLMPQPCPVPTLPISLSISCPGPLTPVFVPSPGARVSHPLFQRPPQTQNP